MPDFMTVDIQGIKDLNRRLMRIARSLDPVKAEPILLRGAEVIAAAARQEAPYAEKPKQYAKSAHLRDSLVAKNLRRVSGTATGAIAAIDRKVVPHWFIAQRGTKDRFTKKGAARGKVKPNRFLRRARKRVEQQVVNYVANEVVALIREAAKS